MILSGNSVEHLLLSLGAYTAGVPVMPISVAYSLMSGDHARIKSIAELTRPGLVFADDARQFQRRAGRAGRRCPDDARGPRSAPRSAGAR